MALIIAGRFRAFADAERVSQQLLDQGTQSENIQTIYVNPPGQHAVTPIGGDEDADPGARTAGRTSWAGVVVGAVIGAIVGAILMFGFNLGIASMVIPTLIGAFGGALGGAYGGMHDARSLGREVGTGKKAEARPSGVLLAIRVAESADEDAIAQALQRGGAHEVERAEGQWRAGQWIDFDPVRRGEPVRQAAGVGV